MNDIMAKDPQCSRQKIQIGTYKVIPMSGSLGILEWVDNTKPLRHCIEGEVVRKDLWKKSQEKYSKFVASFKGDMMGKQSALLVVLIILNMAELNQDWLTLVLE